MSDLSLNELTLENIGSWPMPVKLVVIAVAFIIILALGYFLSFKEQLLTLESFKDKEFELIQTMEQKQQQAANIDKYRAQLKEMEKKFGVLLKRLPGKSEIPELLEEISQRGLNAGLKFQLFDPQPEIPHEFYVEVPIKITVDGSYHQLAEFISQVASMKRIVTVHDFEIRFPDPKKTESKKPIRMIDGKLPLFMDLTAKVYRYRTFE
jgi:type IV pilus assembly protein PilO